MSSTTDESGCSGNANEQERSRSSYSRRLTLAQQQLARFTDSRSSREQETGTRQQLATFTDSQSRRRRRVPRQQLDRFNSGRRYTVSQIRRERRVLSG
ncbi:hypothetical protein AAFF_G00161550 [Aldrovandia affinis]|uniref:Uncharacterized protein n=1 Tax=Aldrovandia affinis TaxID=143900 RepID=A0AAD7RMD7_9TELE|nr:hypothetical protein AAFF_G00161550 [Aldrovandia affinis]